MFVLTLKYLISGNASQVSDGAGAVLLMKRRVALEKNLPILGVFRFVFSALFLRTRQTAGDMIVFSWYYCIGKDVAICMHGLLISVLLYLRIFS